MRWRELLILLLAAGCALSAAGAHADVGSGLSGAIGECLERYRGGEMNTLQGNADTVDWFHASGTPKANTLLALDGAKHFPVSVLPDNSIPGGKLALGAVTAGRLADNSVTTSKIVNQAVTGGKLAYGAVTAGRLADNSVTTSKIVNGTIEGQDLRTPFNLTGNNFEAVMSVVNYFAPYGGNYGVALKGRHATTTGRSYGVWGQSHSDEGIGVFGWATDWTGTNYGVYGNTDSALGFGVYTDGHLHVQGNITA